MAKIVQDARSGEQYEMYFHVDVLLSDGYMRGSDNNPVLKRLLGIHGVQGVSVCRYKVSMERSKAVEWDVIVPKAMEILEAECARIASEGATH